MNEYIHDATDAHVYTLTMQDVLPVLKDNTTVNSAGRFSRQVASLYYQAKVSQKK